MFDWFTGLPVFSKTDFEVSDVEDVECCLYSESTGLWIFDARLIPPQLKKAGRCRMQWDT